MSALVAGCDGNTVTTPSGARAVVVLRSTQLHVGDTMTVRAAFRYADGRLVDLSVVSASSSAPAIVAVDASARLRAVATGTSRIHATTTTNASADTTVTVLP